jgi:hypothetical protein
VYWNFEFLTVIYFQVKKMFGDDNTRPLLLPIIFDLANLVREGFLRSDKYQEHEKQNKNQFLRRSFSVDAKPFEKPQATKEIDFAAPSNLMRDETLSVDEGEMPRIKNVERFDDIKPEALVQIVNSSFNSVTERAITAFTLPRVQPTMNRNMSLEEIEDLAFSGLNGTVVDQSIKDVNGSELSPEALIGGRRKKKPGKGGPFPESCERFTGGICINVKNYPLNDIMGSIRRHRHAMDALLAEYRDKSAELEQLDYLGDPTADLSDLR